MKRSSTGELSRHTSVVSQSGTLAACRPPSWR
jgi:hypothetical protein